MVGFGLGGLGIAAGRSLTVLGSPGGGESAAVDFGELLDQEQEELLVAVGSPLVDHFCLGVGWEFLGWMDGVGLFLGSCRWWERKSEGV